MISSDVVIITRAELQSIKDGSFSLGVARGRFEERSDAARAARIISDAVRAADKVAQS